VSTDPQAITVALAEERAAAARQRLTATAGTLQVRLNPRAVARDAVENLQESGEKALRSGVETVRANPEAVVWAVTLATAWAARHRIGALFGRPRPKRETAPRSARSIPGDWPPGDLPYVAERKDT
jgi:hypothetical protein